jgi:NifB/MoaA-like Fe-S oxidoreductase
MSDERTHHRRNAAECLDLALRTTNPTTRNALLALAQRSLEFADGDSRARRLPDQLQDFQERCVVRDGRNSGSA